VFNCATVRSTEQKFPFIFSRIYSRSASLSHGGDLSGIKAACRILRSSSANTASVIQKAKNHAIRKNPAVCQLFPPLSQGPARNSSTSRRQVSGSTASTSSSYRIESQTRSHHHKKRVRRHISETSYPSTIFAHLGARALLSQARRFIELEADLLGRKSSIMDVILDLKSAALGDEGAVLREVIQRTRMPFPVCREYTFTDEQSLVIYWADQAAIWGGMRTVIEVSPTHFPDSGERSTASWVPALNGRSED
jgi:hypothetical protein